MNKYTIKAARKGKPTKELIYNERQLIDVFKAYKTHRKADTFTKKEVLKSGANAGQTVDIEINKPFTLTSFCHFAVSFRIMPLFRCIPSLQFHIH